MTEASSLVLKIAFPNYSKLLFDYHPPNGFLLSSCLEGARVRAFLGKVSLIGIIFEKAQNEVPLNKIKSVESILDSKKPFLSKEAMSLAGFLSSYYLCSPSESVAKFLPTILQESKISLPKLTVFRPSKAVHSESNLDELFKNAKAQKSTLKTLLEYGEINSKMLHALGLKKTILKALSEKGLVLIEEIPFVPEQNITPKALPAMSDEQNQAFGTLEKANGFVVHLIFGVTGSGKTRVYLHKLHQIFQQNPNAQALILVPEIGLITPIISQISPFVSVPVFAHYGSLSATKKSTTMAWLKNNKPALVIGTRSALFLPFSKLSWIAVDEEHDASYKNVGSPPYHARDVAIKLASINQIPIALASATPSLRSLHNVTLEKYQMIRMEKRVQKSGIEFSLLPMQESQEKPFHPLALKHLSSVLKEKRNALIFLNRRGYSPLLYCKKCGYDAPCPNCSVRLTLHQGKKALICHHCGHQTPIPQSCPTCQEKDLIPLGFGTERLVDYLKVHFKNNELIQIDQDQFESTQNNWEALYHKLHQNKKGTLLVGTQMSTKGHNFPKLDLVVIQNADPVLFSGDPFSGELTAQLINQVSGRAGRFEKEGRVLLQTRYPNSKLLNATMNLDYQKVSSLLLEERKKFSLTPYHKMAVIYVYAKQEFTAEKESSRISALLTPFEGISWLGPIPSLIPKRKHYYYFQIIIKSHQTSYLRAPLLLIQKTKCFAKVWIDIDPVSLY